MSKVINFIEAASKFQLSRLYNKKPKYDQINEEDSVVYFSTAKTKNPKVSDKSSVVDKLSVQSNSNHVNSKD